MSFVIGIKQADGSITPLDLNKKNAVVRVTLSPAHKDQDKFELDWYSMPQNRPGNPVKTGSRFFSRHELETADHKLSGLVFLREGKQVVCARQSETGQFVPVCTVPTHATYPAGFVLKIFAGIAYAAIVVAGILFLLSFTSPGFDVIKLLRSVFQF